METKDNIKDSNPTTQDSSTSYGTRISQIYSKLPLNFSTITGLRFPHIPRLKGSAILGRLPHLLKENGILNNLFSAAKLAKQHKSGMCYYWLGHKMVLVITRPEHIQQLLILNHHNNARAASYKMFKIFVGSNIIIDPHDLWKLKKDIYSDWLHKTSILTQHEPKMLALVKKYTKHLQENSGEPINLQEVFTRFSLEMVLETVILPHAADAECVRKLQNYNEEVTREVFEFRNIFKWTMPGFIRRLVFKEPIQKVEAVKCAMRKQFNDILLAPHEKEIKNNDNFIHSLFKLTKHDENDALVDDPNVFGDGNMLLLAGQESSVATLEFAIMSLCANPSAEAKLRTELNENLKGQELSVEHINNLPFLDMVVKETLRLFPTVPLLPRDIQQPFVIGDVPLAKGDTVIFSPYLTHHLESLWENPEEFKPERFDKSQDIPHQAYLPFGAGAHMCIGSRFALQEIKLLLASIYLNFNVEMDNHDLEIRLDQGALKPKNIPWARFTAIV